MAMKAKMMVMSTDLRISTDEGGYGSKRPIAGMEIPVLAVDY